MQLIFGKENAEQVREKYTVLDLETLTIEGKSIDVFCVIPAEKIAMQDIALLANHIDMHNKFVTAFAAGDYQLCKDLYIHVMGKFSGEVDSFYEVILQRINDHQACVE